MGVVIPAETSELKLEGVSDCVHASPHWDESWHCEVWSRDHGISTRAVNTGRQEEGRGRQDSTSWQSIFGSLAAS